MAGLTRQPSAEPTGNSDEVDPRRLRSRARLLDAATQLFRTGGIDAVTIDAVTRASKVARTTLYRHFGSSSQLLSATFDRLLSQITPATPAAGPVRCQLVELLNSQAEAFAQAPLQIISLAWLSLGKPVPDGDDASEELRHRLVDQYRQPFLAVFTSPEAQAELGEIDLDWALCQLIGPLLFARMTGLHQTSYDDCINVVDAYLAVTRQADSGRPPATP
jgi:AcrR family transcriptional regulator